MNVFLRDEIVRKGVKIKHIANEIGCWPNSLSVRLKKNSFSLDEAEQILNCLGLELVVREKAHATSKGGG